MSTPVLIGLVGLRRSGKDTAAQALIEDGFENVKFAGALKAMLYAYFDYVGTCRTSATAAIDGQAKEIPLGVLGGKSTRHAMQTLGTEWGRDLIHPDIWVSAAINRARQFEKAVISDVRFQNEVDAVRASGGKIIKVIRHGTSVDNHPSEMLVSTLDYDWAICNDGTIQELHANVRDAVTKLWANT